MYIENCLNLLNNSEVDGGGSTARHNILSIAYIQQLSGNLIAGQADVVSVIFDHLILLGFYRRNGRLPKIFPKAQAQESLHLYAMPDSGSNDSWYASIKLLSRQCKFWP